MRSQLVIGIMFVLVGIGILFAAPVVRVTLDAGPGGVACRLERRVLGLLPIKVAEVRGIKGARVDRVPYGPRETATTFRAQVVLNTANGVVRPDWLWWVDGPAKQRETHLIRGPDLAGLEGDINALARADSGHRQRNSWSLVPVSIGAGALIFGILALSPWLVPARRPSRRAGAR